MIKPVDHHAGGAGADSNAAPAAPAAPAGQDHRSNTGTRLPPGIYIYVFVCNIYRFVAGGLLVPGCSQLSSTQLAAVGQAVGLHVCVWLAGFILLRSCQLFYFFLCEERVKNLCNTGIVKEVARKRITPHVVDRLISKLSIDWGTAVLQCQTVSSVYCWTYMS